MFRKAITFTAVVAALSLALLAAAAGNALAGRCAKCGTPSPSWAPMHQVAAQYTTTARFQPAGGRCRTCG